MYGFTCRYPSIRTVARIRTFVKACAVRFYAGPAPAHDVRGGRPHRGTHDLGDSIATSSPPGVDRPLRDRATRRAGARGSTSTAPTRSKLAAPQRSRDSRRHERATPAPRQEVARNHARARFSVLRGHVTVRHSTGLELKISAHRKWPSWEDTAPPVPGESADGVVDRQAGARVGFMRFYVCGPRVGQRSSEILIAFGVPRCSGSEASTWGREWQRPA